jgi:hypothetical protein
MIERVVGAGQYRLVMVDGYTPTSGAEHRGSPDEPRARMDVHGVETAFLFDPPVVTKSRRRGC